MPLPRGDRKRRVVGGQTPAARIGVPRGGRSAAGKPRPHPGHRDRFQPPDAGFGIEAQPHRHQGLNPQPGPGADGCVAVGPRRFRARSWLGNQVQALFRLRRCNCSTGSRIVNLASHRKRAANATSSGALSGRHANSAPPPFPMRQLFGDGALGPDPQDSCRWSGRRGGRGRRRRGTPYSRHRPPERPSSCSSLSPFSQGEIGPRTNLPTQGRAGTIRQHSTVARGMATASREDEPQGSVAGGATVQVYETTDLGG